MMPVVLCAELHIKGGRVNQVSLIFLTHHFEAQRLLRVLNIRGSPPENSDLARNGLIR